MELRGSSNIPEHRKYLVDRLQVMADVEVLNKDPSEEEITKKIEDADIAISLRLTAKTIDAAKKLRFIQLMGAGTDRVDVEAATKKVIPVCNVSGVNAETLAQRALAHILNIASRISFANNSMRASEWKPDIGLDGFLLWGKTLGIVGFGNIGQRVALKSRLAFSMKIIAYDPHILQTTFEMFGAEAVGLKALMREADIVTIHSMLTKETRHIIGEKELGLMKKSAIIVNTARGPIIDEKALIKCLKEKRILGAGLDVFEEEPIPKDSSLLKMDNVVLSPHMNPPPEVGFASFDAIIDNVSRFLAGKSLLRVVNPIVLGHKPASAD